MEEKVPDLHKHNITQIISNLRQTDYERLYYPNVIITNNGYKIKIEIGTVKHHLPKKILKVPLRMVHLNLNEFEYEVEFVIFAKNLKKPIKDRVKIKYIYNKSL